MPWQDNPSGGLFADPTSGGIGFDNWTSSEQGTLTNAGYFTGQPFFNSSGGLYSNLASTDGNAFGMYGELAGNEARCFRKLLAPLALGGNFAVKLGMNYLNGYKGVIFRKSTTGPVFIFQGAGNAYQFNNNWNGSSWDPGSWQNAPWLYKADSVIFIQFDRITSNFANITMTRPNTPTRDQTTTNVTTNTDIDQIDFFIGGTDALPDIENNLYFNFLSAFTAYR